MFNKQILKVMINERLSEAAGEIFALFEQALAEYQREIDRLKTGSDDDDAADREEELNYPDPQSLQRVPQTETSGQGNEKSPGSVKCKEEIEKVLIKQEAEAQMLITNVESYGQDLKAHGHQQNANREGPEASGAGAEADSCSKEEQLHFGSEVSKKPFSFPVRHKGFPNMKMHKRRFLTVKRILTSAESNDQLDSEEFISHMETSEQSQPDIARPFGCTFCERRFKLKITLEAHMRSHAGENPCSCTNCGVTFKKQSYLINHIHRVHSKVKPLQCTLCNKGFVHPNAFKTHMNSHTGERPFKCALCGKGFTQKGTLKRHMVTHTGEKPFICSSCGKNYSTKQNLTNHMQKNHWEGMLAN